MYGIGCVMNHWAPQIKYFSQSFQTITMDYRGHHKSAPPEDPSQLSIACLVKDLQILLQHLDIPKASFWGHSFGAQVLTAAYEKQPEAFENIIFVNGFVKNPIQGMFGSQWPHKIFHRIRSAHEVFPDTFGYLWKKIINQRISIYLSSLLGGFNLQLTHLKDIEIYIRGVASVDLECFLALFEDMMHYDGSHVLNQIECPALIIAGEKDSVTPFKHQEEIHQGIVHSELLIVPVGSHCSQLDMSDLINLRAEKFLVSSGQISPGQDLKTEGKK